MIEYKVEISNSPNWQSFDTATLGVSIESPNWKGEKLAAILDFVAKRFRHLQIDVTDTLYRHKFMAASLDDGSAYCGAQALGSLWLTQHADMIEACPIEKTIIRWEEWYKHRDYQETLKLFQRAFGENQIFHEAVCEDVRDFCHRQKKPLTDQIAKHSVDFLVEEVAVISLQAKETKSVRLYPGEDLECMRVVRAGLVSGTPDWLRREQFARIKFKKRKAPLSLASSAGEKRAAQL